MDSDDKLGLAIFGGCLLVVVAVIGGIVVEGLVLSVLWGWFMVPILGVPVLTLAQAYGVSLVFAALQGYREPAQNDENTSVAKSLTKLLTIMVFRPALLIGLGWIFKSLI